LLIALCSLLIVSCDLFNSAMQPDYLAKIDAEIAWANAARLNVSVGYPNAWGTSSPQAGQITPSLDIRQGYAFEIEFTPGIEYSFLGWRAYATEALNALGNWRQDLTLLEEMVDGEIVIRVPQLSGVETPELSARGGSGSFTINTVTPVTLVPWCKAEPYVIRTDPRSENKSSTDTSGYPPATPIVVYFNTALSSDMKWDFEDGIVDIKARPFSSIPDGDFTIPYNDRFDRIEYESKGGQNMLTIYPRSSTPPDVNHQIEVTLGPNIKNSQGDFMNSPEVIYYKVSEQTVSDARIAGWTASYNNSNEEISISYTLSGNTASSARATAYYQMNQGSNQTIELPLTGTTRSGTISRISGVTEGVTTGNIREYRVVMELSVDGSLADRVEFKIWNFPGMSVSKTNPAIEVTSASGDNDESDGTISLSSIAVNSPNKQYVLANDITVTSHTPIGTGTAAFTGKFYGNNHKITITGFANSQYTGLFGYTNNALIRDLSVVYDATIASNSTIQYLGGIAGYAAGTTDIRNIITSGSLGATLAYAGEKYIGGITGYMASTVTITNIRAGLDLNAAATGSNDVYFGGITGDTATGGTGDLAIDKVNVTGALTHNQTGGVMYTGGIAGRFRASLSVGEYKTDLSVSNIEFSGKLEAGKNDESEYNYVGGILGRAEYGTFLNCRVSGSIRISSKTSYNYLGGLAGR
jgi:hypothetical protein